jgi:hypothetical protein
LRESNTGDILRPRAPATETCAPGAISGKLLWSGGTGGVLMIIGNIVSLAGVISQGRVGSLLYWPVFGLLVGALLTSYFCICSP